MKKAGEQLVEEGEGAKSSASSRNYISHQSYHIRGRV